MQAQRSPPIRIRAAGLTNRKKQATQGAHPNLPSPAISSPRLNAPHLVAPYSMSPALPPPCSPTLNKPWPHLVVPAVTNSAPLVVPNPANPGPFWSQTQQTPALFGPKPSKPQPLLVPDPANPGPLWFQTQQTPAPVYLIVPEAGEDEVHLYEDGSEREQATSQ